MALDSSSTRTQVLAQYNDNLSWDGNPTKAALALEAIRWLLINRPVGMTQDGKGGVNYASIEAEKTKLEKYVADFGSSVNKAAFVKARPIS